MGKTAGSTATTSNPTIQTTQQMAGAGAGSGSGRGGFTAQVVFDHGAIEAVSAAERLLNLFQNIVHNIVAHSVKLNAEKAGPGLSAEQLVACLELAGLQPPNILSEEEQALLGLELVREATAKQLDLAAANPPSTPRKRVAAEVAPSTPTDAPTKSKQVTPTKFSSTLDLNKLSLDGMLREMRSYVETAVEVERWLECVGLEIADEDFDIDAVLEEQEETKRRASTHGAQATTTPKNKQSPTNKLRRQSAMRFADVAGMRQRVQAAFVEARRLQDFMFRFSQALHIVKTDEHPDGVEFVAHKIEKVEAEKRGFAADYVGTYPEENNKVGIAAALKSGFPSHDIAVMEKVASQTNQLIVMRLPKKAGLHTAKAVALQLVAAKVKLYQKRKAVLKRLSSENRITESMTADQRHEVYEAAIKEDANVVAALQVIKRLQSTGQGKRMNLKDKSFLGRVFSKRNKKCRVYDPEHGVLVGQLAKKNKVAANDGFIELIEVPSRFTMAEIHRLVDAKEILLPEVDSANANSLIIKTPDNKVLFRLQCLPVDVEKFTSAAEAGKPATWPDELNWHPACCFQAYDATTNEIIFNFAENQSAIIEKPDSDAADAEVSVDPEAIMPIMPDDDLGGIWPGVNSIRQLRAQGFLLRQTDEQALRVIKTCGEPSPGKFGITGFDTPSVEATCELINMTSVEKGGVPLVMHATEGCAPMSKVSATDALLLIAPDGHHVLIQSTTQYVKALALAAKNGYNPVANPRWLLDPEFRAAAEAVNLAQYQNIVWKPADHTGKNLAIFSINRVNEAAVKLAYQWRFLCSLSSEEFPHVFAKAQNRVEQLQEEFAQSIANNIAQVTAKLTAAEAVDDAHDLKVWTDMLAQLEAYQTLLAEFEALTYAELSAANFNEVLQTMLKKYDGSADFFWEMTMPELTEQLAQAPQQEVRLEAKYYLRAAGRHAKQTAVVEEERITAERAAKIAAATARVEAERVQSARQVLTGEVVPSTPNRTMRSTGSRRPSTRRAGRFIKANNVPFQSPINKSVNRFNQNSVPRPTSSSVAIRKNPSSTQQMLLMSGPFSIEQSRHRRRAKLVAGERNLPAMQNKRAVEKVPGKASKVGMYSKPKEKQSLRRRIETARKFSAI
jgi:hypothetical protein